MPFLSVILWSMVKHKIKVGLVEKFTHTHTMAKWCFKPAVFSVVITGHSEICAHTADMYLPYPEFDQKYHFLSRNSTFINKLI